MSQLITPPETPIGPKPLVRMSVLQAAEPQAAAPHDPLAALGRAALFVLRALIVTVLAIGSVVVLSFAFNPVVFVTCMLFAPVLAPVILAALAIVVGDPEPADEAGRAVGQTCLCR